MPRTDGLLSGLDECLEECHGVPNDRSRAAFAAPREEDPQKAPAASPRRRLARHPRPDAVAAHPRPVPPARPGRGRQRSVEAVLPLVRRPAPRRVPVGRPAVAVPARSGRGAPLTRARTGPDVLSGLCGPHAGHGRRDRARPRACGHPPGQYAARRRPVDGGPAAAAAHPARTVRRPGHRLRGDLPAGGAAPRADVRRLRRTRRPGEGVAGAGPDRHARAAVRPGRHGPPPWSPW